MTTHSAPRQWWHCHHESEKNERIDTLCQQGWSQGYRVAVLATPEQLVSNLSVQENIMLPQQWHKIATTLDTATNDGLQQCLQHCLRKDQTLDHFLHLQGAKLNSQQRRWVGLARALHFRANYVVLDDDEKNPFPFGDERLHIIDTHLPEATVHWVSLRAAASLPDHWLIANSGVDT